MLALALFFQTALTPGRPASADLRRGDTVRYTVDLGARQFVYGEADQQSVDVIVSVFAPDGRRLLLVDETARGPDVFQFRSTTAGAYRIEVTPFEQGEGRFGITLMRVEPVATDPTRQVDQLMASFSGNRPGGVVAVTRGGRIVFARAYGMANLEDSIPNTTETVFHIASVSKQFTAFSIALLADEGRLSLDDDIRRYLPRLHDFGRTITIRNLLNHTSGLRDQWELWAMAGGRLDDVIRQQDLLQLIERQRELNFAPGSEYLYSNTGFTLLGEIVARVSGQSLRDFTRARIFEPLGMTSTQFYDDHERLVRHRAYSYHAGDDGPRKSVLSYANVGATSLFTTVGDLARWLANWHTGAVGGHALQLMQQRGVLTGGDTIDYALGVSIDTWRGQRRISHNGSDAGYRAQLTWLPALDAGVIILGNTASLNVSGLGNDVAEAFFGDALAPAARPQPRPTVSPAPAPWTPDSAALASYTGRFWSEELETMYEIVMVDGRLVARHRRHGDLVLRPLQRNEFGGSEFFFSRVRFERDAAGQVSGFRLTGGRARNLSFRRM